MAIVKQRLHRKNSSGTYDVIHLETDSSMVKMSDGATTLQTAIDGKAASNHNHDSTYSKTNHTHSGYASSTHNHDTVYSKTDHTHTQYAASSHKHNASDINAGTLSVARGGTGKATFTSGSLLVGAGTGALSEMTVADLKKTLDSTKYPGSTGTPPTYPASIGNVGATMAWANKTWRIVHKVSGMAVLALETMEKSVQFSAHKNNGYFGSKLWVTCMGLAVTLNLLGVDYIIPMCGLPVFVAGADQLSGGFSYFTSGSTRICKLGNSATIYWTSTPCSGGGVCYVDNYGTVDTSGDSYCDPTKTYGFRPFVALRV